MEAAAPCRSERPPEALDEDVEPFAPDVQTAEEEEQEVVWGEAKALSGSGPARQR